MSTIDDYLRFLRMMLNHGELDGVGYLQPASVTEMTRDQLAAGQKTGPHAEPFMAGGGAGWGLGMSVAIARTRPWLMPGRFVWNGGYGTTAYADPVNDLIGIFFSQRIASGLICGVHGDAQQVAALVRTHLARFLTPGRHACA